MKTTFLLFPIVIIAFVAVESMATTQLTGLEKQVNSNAIVENSLKRNLKIGGAVRVNYSYK